MFSLAAFPHIRHGYTQCITDLHGANRDPQGLGALHNLKTSFSAILSASVGSIVKGLTSGWYVAFMAGWISWLTVARVLLGGFYVLYRSITDS